VSTNVPDPRRVEYLPLEDLAADPRNPKAHDEETIDDSIGRFGMLDLIVRDERTGRIISGHGRSKALAAREARGESAPEGVKVDEEGRWLVPVVVGWASRTDTEAAAALIALNRTTELGGWVDDALLDLLDDLDDGDDGLLGVGFDEEDVEALREAMAELADDDGTSLADPHADLPLGDEEEEEDADEDFLGPTGQEFERLDVLWGEPSHQVKHGETYVLGGRHLLVVAKLAREHDLWAHHLPGRVFAPYPDPYLVLGESAKTEPYLLVQPNAYLAGHVLDKWASIHGEESIERQVSA
jgi:hypothetical protein